MKEFARRRIYCDARAWKFFHESGEYLKWFFQCIKSRRVSALVTHNDIFWQLLAQFCKRFGRYRECRTRFSLYHEHIFLKREMKVSMHTAVQHIHEWSR